jgi:hypothetical protein
MSITYYSPLIGFYNIEDNIIKKTELFILTEFADDIFIEIIKYLNSIENFRYIVTGGSSIGLMRDGNLLLWDDDIDIVVESIYEKKLIDILINNRLVSSFIPVNKIKNFTSSSLVCDTYSGYSVNFSVDFFGIFYMPLFVEFFICDYNEKENWYNRGSWGHDGRDYLNKTQMFPEKKINYKGLSVPLYKEIEYQLKYQYGDDVFEKIVIYNHTNITKYGVAEIKNIKENAIISTINEITSSRYNFFDKFKILFDKKIKILNNNLFGINLINLPVSLLELLSFIYHNKINEIYFENSDNIYDMTIIDITFYLEKIKHKCDIFLISNKNDMYNKYATLVIKKNINIDKTLIIVYCMIIKNAILLDKIKLFIESYKTHNLNLNVIFIINQMQHYLITTKLENIPSMINFKIINLNNCDDHNYNIHYLHDTMSENINVYDNVAYYIDIPIFINNLSKIELCDLFICEYNTYDSNWCWNSIIKEHYGTEPSFYCQPNGIFGKLSDFVFLLKTIKNKEVEFPKIEVLFATEYMYNVNKFNMCPMIQLSGIINK